MADSELLRRFFATASDDAERAAHRVRVTVMALVLVRLVLVAWPEMLEGVFKHWFTTGVVLAGMVASGVLARAVVAARRKEPLLLASTVLDAALAFLIVAPSVVWPRERFVGVLASPDFAIWPIVAIGAGLRLSPRAAATGSAAALGGVAALVGLDYGLNADRLRYGAAEIALALLLMVSAGLLARAIDVRSRSLVDRGAAEAVRGERARSRLGAYVSEEVAELALREEDVLPGGVERSVAVLFSDLRGFTRSGQHRSPDVVIAELNAYLEAMVPAIREHGGVVDKYIGDAILAVYGIPEATGDEAGRAIRSAAAMMAALDAHNRDRASQGLEPLRHGIGVHYGPVAAGHVGTRERLQYTVIGDTVNVAARLQTASKELGVDVVLADAVVARARSEGEVPAAIFALPPIELRGRDGAIAVHGLGRAET